METLVASPMAQARSLALMNRDTTNSKPIYHLKMMKNNSLDNRVCELL
jgi:hypothetical protein